MPITLKQIEAFLAVARTLNFSQAADAVHLSQPALSANIRRLEQVVGARLFDRDTRTVALSAVGREFHEIASGITYQVRHGLDHMHEIVAGSLGHLNIAVAPSVAASFLPNVLVKYKAAYPQIKVTLYDVMTDAGIDMVRSGNADIALMPQQPEAGDLQQHVLFRDPLVVLCATGHPLSSRENLNWADILSHDLIVREHDSSVHQLLKMQYLRHGKILEPSFMVNNVGTALGLIAAGLGIGVVPSSLLHTINMVGTRCCRFQEESVTYWTICASVPKIRARAPATGPFIRLCIEHLQSSELYPDPQ